MPSRSAARRGCRCVSCAEVAPASPRRRPHRPRARTIAVALTHPCAAAQTVFVASGGLQPMLTVLQLPELGKVPPGAANAASGASESEARVGIRVAPANELALLDKTCTLHA